MTGLRVVVVAIALAAVGLSGCVFYLDPKCNDQIRNGDETDLDCGGGTCGQCNVGDSCKTDQDCAESMCSHGVCTPLQCENGMRDGQETDVDCGGGACRRCAGGNTCAGPGDCFNDTCVPRGDGNLICAELATVSFAAPVSYPTGDKAYALGVGNLDSDVDPEGPLDLVVTNELDSTIRVFLNDGLGNFEASNPPTGAFATGVFPTSIVLADLDGDGRLDVVTSDFRGRSVSVLLNQGGGSLAPVATYSTGVAAEVEVSNLAVADLNGDSRLDVVATTLQDAAIHVFLGNGDGTLGPPRTIVVGTPGDTQPYSVVIGNFDGDTSLDVAIGDQAAGPILLMHGNGDGTFRNASTDIVHLDSGGSGPITLISADLNNDGLVDLVSANRGSDDVSVLLGRSDGMFRKAIVSSVFSGAEPMTVAGPYTVAVADFNGDRVPDLVTANFEAGRASVLIGLGDGHFKPALDGGATGAFVPGTQGPFPYGVIAADLNGDNLPDFAIANALANTVTVALSTSH